MAIETDVNDAKVRALDALVRFLDVLTECGRAGLKEMSDRNPTPAEGDGARRARS